MHKLALAGSLLVSSLAFAQSNDLPGLDASYVLKVEAPPSKKGEHAVAKIRITPGAGYHMNKEYPTSLALTPPAGVSFDKPKLTGKDAAKLDNQVVEFDVAYTAAQPGKKTVAGEIKFAVCSANSCDPKKSQLKFEIEVH
jgi:hypothetical protein